MIRKLLITFLLLVSVFANSYKTLTLAELEEHHQPKIVVFGDSTEQATLAAFDAVESTLKGFGDKIKLDFLVVDRASGEDEAIFAHEAFNALPILFIQGPEETSPSRYAGEVTQSGLTEHISELLSQPDYSKVVKFTTKKAFTDLFLKEQKPILVKHFEEWCGHCKALKPHFARAAAKTNDVIFMEVECSKDDESKEFCNANQVRGYPTIKLFNGKWSDYQGARTTSGLLAFCEENLNIVPYDPAEEERIAKEENSFVDPVPCDFIDMTLSSVESDQDPKFVVFGDIRQTSAQKTYKVIADAAKRINWPYKIVRVEAHRSANTAVFESDFFKNQVRLFVVAPGSQNPTFFEGNVNSEEEIASFVSELLVEPDYSYVHEFSTEEDLYKLAKQQKKPILVKHFEQWCGHCKALKPHFARAAQKADNAIFMEVECSKTPESRAFCEKQGIQGYPTLKVWNGASWKEFNAPRTTNGLVSSIAEFEYKAGSEKSEESSDASVSTTVKSMVEKVNMEVKNAATRIIAGAAVAKNVMMKKYQTGKKIVMDQITKKAL